MSQTSKFFNDLFGKRKVHFRCFLYGTKERIDSYGYIDDPAIYSRLKHANDQKYEVYFVPNSGGYKDEQINRFNAVFIDLDCGRDSNKNYFPIDIVNQYKQDQIDILHRFKHLPSYIIETRNGLQVYWLLNEGATLEHFNECEERLTQYFSADKKVKNPARLMRVPGFYWSKNPNERFMAKIIENNEVRYDIQTIIDSLPLPTQTDTKGFYDYNTLVKNKESNYCHKTLQDDKLDYLNINLIKQSNIKLSRIINHDEQIKFSNRKEIYDYLKKQDLHNYLGIHHKNFKCIFHNDKSPSASIYKDPKTDYWWYKCHSESCGFKGTIIQVTEKLSKLSNFKALKYLMQIYNITLEKTDWQKEQEELLQQNLELLNDDEAIKEMYPNFHSMMKSDGYYALLREFHLIALENLSSLSKVEGRDNAIIYLSIDYIMNRLDKYYKFSSFKSSNKKRAFVRISLFTYLKLLEKLGIEDIPKPFVERAKAEARKKKYSNTISFYSIPSYDANTLGETELMAKKFKDLHMTISNFDREMLLRVAGEEEANRVFPMRKGNKLSEANDETVKKLEQTALRIIQKKGWVTEDEIINETLLGFDSVERMKMNIKSKKKEEITFTEEQVQKWEYSFKKSLLKKSLGSIISGYGLIRLRLNKKLKEQLNITELDPNCFPYILIKEKNAQSSSQDERTA